MELSVIIPTYNSSSYILETIETVSKYLADNFANSEIIIVDNGSNNETIQVYSTISMPANVDIRVIKFESNYGQKFSVIKGLNSAKSTYALTFDDDLQFRIQDVKKALDLFREKEDLLIVNSKTTNNAKERVRRLVSLPMLILFPVYLNAFYFCSFKVYNLKKIKSKGLINPFLFWQFPTMKMAYIELKKSKGIRTYSNYSIFKNIILSSTILIKAIEKMSVAIFILFLLGSIVFAWSYWYAFIPISTFLLAKLVLGFEQIVTRKIMRKTL